MAYTFPPMPAPPLTTNAPVVLLEEIVLLLATILPLKTAIPLPVLVMVPVVDSPPVAASIVSGPTVSPLCTIKFVLAIDPYLPAGC